MFLRRQPSRPTSSPHRLHRRLRWRIAAHANDAGDAGVDIATDDVAVAAPEPEPVPRQRTNQRQRLTSRPSSSRRNPHLQRFRTSSSRNPSLQPSRKGPST